MKARKDLAYGAQRDYLDHGNCIGWTREGDAEHPGSGCAVLMSNGDDGFKTMEVGKAHAGKTFIDYLGKHPAKIKIDAEGKAVFPVGGGQVAVWVASK